MGGSSSSVSFESLKAFWPMEMSVSGSVSFVKLERSKACSPMEVSVGGQLEHLEH